MIAIGSDHNGFQMKEELKSIFDKEGIEYIDAGPKEFDAKDDYPIFAKSVAKLVSEKKADKGVLICGTGIGMMMCANRQKGVRAVNTDDDFCVMRSRLHNDANVICLGASVVDTKRAKQLIDIFLKTDFEGGRHQSRIEMMDE